MNRRRITILTIGVLLFMFLPRANGMPLFARKYGVTCNVCHNPIPRLTEFGYKFRAAGFRLPEEIGKEDEKKFELGDYFSSRLQARLDYQATNQPNGAAVPNVIAGVAGPRTTTTSLSFQEFTLYPLTGSWDKHFGSLAELSVSPEDFFEIENAYLRFVYGDAKKFFTSRIGIFHSWEGFGASDRPFSNARPLFQTSPASASGRGVPYVFQTWGLDEAGIEIGEDIDKLSLRAAVLGGTFIRWEEDSNAFIAFPAQTGPWKGANQAVSSLTKSFDSPGHNTPDFSLNATYLLHANGGGATLLYYHGNVATPTRCTDGTKIGAVNAAGEVCGVSAATAANPFGTAGNTDFDFSKDTAFLNRFDRVAGYLSYPFGKFLPQAGFQLGRDTNPDGSKFDSKGAFVEGAYIFSDTMTAGLRYDWFKPKYAANTFNRQWAVTPYVNIPLQNGFQVIAEYQHRNFQLNASNHRNNDTLQARLIFIK